MFGLDVERSANITCLPSPNTLTYMGETLFFIFYFKK